MSNNSNEDNIIFPTSPPILVRTHKAICPVCYGRSETYDPNNRTIICFYCSVLIIQSNVRGFLVRIKRNRLKKQELMHRIFIKKGLNGLDFVKNIIKFL
jgi:hypothetical protein